MRERSSVSVRSGPSPAASAASNQRRMPYDVVASRTSGRAAMIVGRVEGELASLSASRDPDRRGVQHLGTASFEAPR